MSPPRSASAALLAASIGGATASAAALAAPDAGADARARALELFDGEYLRWEVRYMGVVGGYAEAWTARGEDGALVSTGIAQNAPWYGKVYEIDDRVVSTWRPDGGSDRYSTWFREGGFMQDQDMVFGEETVEVWRHQYFGKKKDREPGWREWTTPYPARAGAEDPVSAFFRMRLMDLGEAQAFPLFSGSETWALEIVPQGRERLVDTALGTIDTRLVELKTRHDGEIEQKGRFLVWVTDDERQVPVRVVVKTNVGPIRADLVSYEAPGTVAEDTPDGDRGDRPAP